MVSAETTSMSRRGTRMSGMPKAPERRRTPNRSMVRRAGDSASTESAANESVAQVDHSPASADLTAATPRVTAEATRMTAMVTSNGLVMVRDQTRRSFGARLSSGSGTPCAAANTSSSVSGTTGNRRKTTVATRNGRATGGDILSP
jgi:hypothetical protein